MKVKIEVTNAVIDGKKHGEQLTVDEKSAKHLIAIGYAKEVVEVSKPVAKEEPKAEAKPKAAPKRNARKKSDNE